MKFPVIFRTPSLLIPGLGHWEKLDREPLDHAFWLFPSDAYRTNVGLTIPCCWRANRQTTLFYAVAEDSPASGQDSTSD